MSDLDQLIWNIFLIAGISIATIFIALGVDFGITLQTILSSLGLKDSLGLRVILVGTGVVIYALIVLWLPDELGSNGEGEPRP